MPLDQSIHGISLNDVSVNLEDSSVIDLYPYISAKKDVDGKKRSSRSFFLIHESYLGCRYRQKPL
jgi:hypothetical protein